MLTDSNDTAYASLLSEQRRRFTAEFFENEEGWRGVGFTLDSFVTERMRGTEARLELERIGRPEFTAELQSIRRE